MTIEKQIDWNTANQSYLMAALKAVQQELESYLTNLDENPDRPKRSLAEGEITAASSDTLPAPAALDNLVNVFGLSAFERKMLLLCAGMELDAAFSTLLNRIQSPNSSYPSFSLALAAFQEAHWSALGPKAPLRFWQLLKVQDNTLITKAALKIDEQVLHYLTGVYYLNEQLEGLIDPIYTSESLVPSQANLANNIFQFCYANRDSGRLPIIHLKGKAKADMQSIAIAATRQMGLSLHRLSIYKIPENTKDKENFLLLWNREAALNARALFIDLEDLDTMNKPKLQQLLSLLEQLQGVLILSSSEWAPSVQRTKLEFEINKPSLEEQLDLWQQHLGQLSDTLQASLQPIIAHFDLSAHTIQAASKHLLSQELHKGYQSDSLDQEIWRTCCVMTRPHIAELTQRIESEVGWDDLVLPEAQSMILREIAMQVRHRNKVYRDWGFRAKGSRGLGISALFSGESGTGKTLASEVLANELKLDLYRIDLSQVVNKYIGETEKNLKRIFDAAEEGSAILLFDEADALFGKRSEVKDSHDRYSNVEVSYLLQRMEAYTGLAILTTNMKGAIDKAFLRRIRFMVPFSYPNSQLRAEIWKRSFPKGAPIKDLDYNTLASLNMPGGNIKNIALNAAFIAADEGEAIQMRHLLRAARTEYRKLDKNLSQTEIRKWH